MSAAYDELMTEPAWVAEAARVIATLECQAWREVKQRHKDWWTMTTTERLAALTYEAGYDDGYDQAVADIAAAWRAAGTDAWGGAA